MRFGAYNKLYKSQIFVEFFAKRIPQAQKSQKITEDIEDIFNEFRLLFFSSTSLVLFYCLLM
jgi:hypothetical protein